MHVEVVATHLGDLDDSSTGCVDLDTVFVVLAEDDRLAVLEPDPVLVSESISIVWLLSMSIVRATKDASAPMARLTGLNGRSMEPIGLVLVIFPTSDVGEYWPLVRP